MSICHENESQQAFILVVQYWRYKKVSLTFQLPLIHEGLQRHLCSRICSSVVLWVRIPKRKNPRNTIWSKDDIPGMTWITFSIYGTHSMFNSPIVSTGKKAVYCLNYTKTQTMTLLSKHEKRDINAPRSISLSSYYKSLVKHQSDKLKFSLELNLVIAKKINYKHNDSDNCKQ